MIARSGASPVLPATISTSPPVAVDLHGPVRAGQAPSVTGARLGDHRVADHAAEHAADVKLDEALRVGRHGRRQVAPASGPLRYLDVDVLAGVVRHRPVEVQAHDREVARDAVVLEDACPPTRPGRPRRRPPRP